MGKKGGGDYEVPEVKEPDPVAPPSPASRGSQEAAHAADDEKKKAKKKFGSNKTVLSRGMTAEQESGVPGKNTLG